jgi:hypothetical protein
VKAEEVKVVKVKETTPEPEFSNIKDYTDLLVSQPALNPDAVQASVSSAFNRILNSQIVFENSPMRRVWQQLLGKMAQNQSLKNMLLDFCTQDFRERYDLVIFWLHEEWRASVHEYSVILEEILNRVLQEDIDRILAKFLVDIPEVFPTTIDLIATLCEDESRTSIGISALRDLILHRPSTRLQAFKILIGFTRHPGFFWHFNLLVKSIRNSSILSVKKWFGSDDAIGLSSQIESYALEGLELLKDPAPERPEDDELQGLWAQEDVTFRLELFLALCSKPNGTEKIGLMRYFLDSY